MMQRETKNRILAGCLAGALPFTSLAYVYAGDDKGWYIGGGLGQSKSDVDEAQIDSLFANSSTTSDERDSAWKFFGGYQFNKNWAIEVAYINLGTSIARQTVPAGTVHVDFEGKGWNLTGVGTLPLGQNFSLLGKLGAFSWDREYKCTRVSVNCNAPANRSASGTDVSYGAGVSYALTKQASLRLEWERFKNVGDENKTRGVDNGKTGQSDVDFLSVGIRYNFF